MSDRELLEAAAKAAGLAVYPWPEEDPVRLNLMGGMEWNPLENDGDALRLAVRLGLEVSCDGKDKVIVGWPDKHHPGSKDGCVFYSHVTEPKGDNPYAATRRAIVRAAARL